MAAAKPTLQQLAILDWLRRFPELRIGERGRWSAVWADEKARLHCEATMGKLFGADTSRLDPGHRGYGNFDGTPECGRSTFEALRRRGWISGGTLSVEGKAALLRDSARLIGFTPRSASEYRPRPTKVTSRLWRRHVTPQGAAQYAEFHEKQAAFHSRLASEIRESLALYEGSPEQAEDQERERVETERRKWAARGKPGP